MKLFDIKPGQLYQYRNSDINLHKNIADKDILFVVSVGSRDSTVYNPRLGQVTQIRNALLSNLLNNRFYLIGK